MRKKYSKEKKHRSGEIPTGSFSDIAFLLIIYFLVATTLLKVNTITADMPSGQKSEQAQQSDKTPIVNLRGNEIYFNDKLVGIVELEQRLQALDLHEQTDARKVILLEATSATSYDVYFQALASISAKGGVVAIVEEEEE